MRNTNESDELFRVSVDSVTSFIVNDLYNKVSENKKIGRKKFAEATASAFDKAASIRSINSNHNRRGDDVAPRDDRGALLQRSKSVYDVLGESLGTQITDTLLSAVQNCSNDEEAELFVSSFSRATVTKMQKTLTAMDNMKTFASFHEETSGESCEELCDELAQSNGSSALFDPSNSFSYHATMHTDEPILRRSSSKQLTYLRRVSEIDWANMSSKWRLDTNSLEEFSSDDEECKEVSLHNEKPIISRKGSDWMLCEDAIR